MVRGSRIEHVCGNPELGPEKDHAYGQRIVRTALRALQTPVTRPTLFDPLHDDAVGAVGSTASLGGVSGPGEREGGVAPFGQSARGSLPPDGNQNAS